jgi:hypothetical protein
VNVALRDSGFPSKRQLTAIQTVGFGASDGFIVMASKGGFQPKTAKVPEHASKS